MKTNQYQLLKTALLAGLLASALPSISSADIIYQDNFTNTAALNGMGPTIDNSGLGATWAANAAYSTDGTTGKANSSLGGGWPDAAILPLDWTTSFSDPRVQVDVKINSTESGNWFVLVFGSSDFWTVGETAALRVRGNGTVEACSGPGWKPEFARATVPGGATAGGWNRLRIDYSNTLSTATFYVNGAIVAQNVPITNNTFGVGFQTSSGSDVLFTNFVVSFGSEGVVIPPSIDTQPVGKAVFTNDPVSLSVEASGTLPLIYQWRKNGVDIPDATGRIYTIPNAAMSDTANFDVVIHNASPNVITSAVAKVQVHYETQSMLAQVNWDEFNSPNWNSSWTWASDASLPLPSVHTNELGAGVGGSHGLKAVADGTSFQELSESWAGFAVATDLSFPKLTAADPYYYIFSYSARVEGLNPDKTNTAGRVNMHFTAPDGTLGGPLDGKLDEIFGVGQPATWTSNFQTFTFVFSSASYGGAAGVAQFARYVDKITAVQLEWSNDSWYTDFPWAPGATIVVDDVKMILRHSPPLSMTWNGTQAVLSWIDPNVQLEGAADVAGPYTAITGATSPYTVPVDSSLKYFRTRFEIHP